MRLIDADALHAVWAGRWECSNCGYCGYRENPEHSEWQYCPNCGAKIEMERGIL